MEYNCSKCKKKTVFEEVDNSRKVKCTVCSTEYNICASKDCWNICKLGFCKECTGRFVKNSNAAIVGGLVLVGKVSWTIYRKSK